MSRFLDISDYNNVNNYEALASSGLIGIICKTSEGTTGKEDTFNDKYDNLKSVGVKVGIYHYLTSTSEPETQAENCANMIQGKEIDIFPIVDVEQDRLANEGKVEDYTKRFIAKFKELTGYDCIIYSGRCYIEDNFSDEFCSNNYWWVADYNGNKPSITKCGAITAWQYTESCNEYEFIDGGVDSNELLDENKFFINMNNKKEEEDVDNTYNFSETYYGDKNPDVVAVYGNSREELLKHYNSCGKNEGRLPTPPTPNFNEAYYLINNPDVNANVSNGGFVSGLAHYRVNGWKENRNWDTPDFTLMTTEEIEKKIEEEVEKYKNTIKNKVNEVLG